jgi:hypothetical protein
MSGDGAVCDFRRSLLGLYFRWTKKQTTMSRRKKIPLGWAGGAPFETVLTCREAEPLWVSRSRF